MSESVDCLFEVNTLLPRQGKEVIRHHHQVILGNIGSHCYHQLAKERQQMPISSSESTRKKSEFSDRMAIFRNEQNIN